MKTWAQRAEGLVLGSRQLFLKKQKCHCDLIETSVPSSSSYKAKNID